MYKYNVRGRGDVYGGNVLAWIISQVHGDERVVCSIAAQWNVIKKPDCDTSPL